MCFMTGLAPGWHLESVDIYDETMGKKFRFRCDRWLAKKEDDGQIMRELACANNDVLDFDEKTSKMLTDTYTLTHNVLIYTTAVVFFFNLLICCMFTSPCL